MSQDRPPDDMPGEPEASSSRSVRAPRPQYSSGRPNYMTVGSGSTSESAARLTAMLDDDSGYGGSVQDGEQSSQRGWHPGLTEDRPTPSHTPLLPGQTNPAAENERRILASHVHQLYYNQNKTALRRAINRTVDTLKRLQEVNSTWPAHYPSVQQPESTRPDSRPGLSHSQSTIEPSSEFASRPNAPRRADTTTEGDCPRAESSADGAQKAVPEPRLVTPQLAQDFSILKIDLKMGALSQAELVHSLEKNSIASLLDGQISKSIRHLYALRERIEDTSSKVLVTGDLNAGKSTFCNALLRRKLLPEDQQPCTSIFCEVLDFKENGGVEEVHAIPVGFDYHRDDERTYHVFGLEDLEKIVTDNERYSQCKIYIKDIRPVDESLLNNGVVDIALIDAPGLNNDSLKTTAVFARQEEIDVVVFVVSAANHFTQSAKEFIFNAAREKAYIFMAVNGFDNIRDKRRCQEMILKQVAHLSPATFKESSELVHFVSSNAIPVAPVGGPEPSGPSGSGGSSSGPDFKDPGDDDDDEPKGKHGEPGSPPGKGKGKEKEKQRDFAELEASLRRFVLEKRARSKLAPAKTYLTNVLGDLNSLASVNRDVAQSELDRVSKELEDLEPIFEQSKKAKSEAGEGVDRTVEDTASEVYAFTRDSLNSTISRIADEDLGLEYPGLFSAYQYAEDLRDAMLEEISKTVDTCEDHAREKTIGGFNSIKNLGLLHLGDGYVDFTIQWDRMFKRRKHILARQVDVEIEPWDFFDFSSIWESQEKVAGTSMAVTVAGVLGGRLIGGVSWLDSSLSVVKLVGVNNVRRMLIPGLIATALLGVSYALASIPRSLPRRLSSKLSSQLAMIDYTHSNAMRISSEVRRALKIPADNLRVGLQRNIEKLHDQREQTTKVKGESEVARKYFGNLVRESHDIRHGVERVDLEGPAPGLGGPYGYRILHGRPRHWPTSAARTCMARVRVGFLFLLLLFLLFSPDPQTQASHQALEFAGVLDAQRAALDVLNGSHYGDFNPQNDRFVNLTGFRQDHNFGWAALSPVKERARFLSDRVLGDAKGRLDGDGEDSEVGTAAGVVPLYHNLTGYAQGQWVRSKVGKGIKPPHVNLSAIVPEDTYVTDSWIRNITGTHGDVRLKFYENDRDVDASPTATSKNASARDVSVQMTIGEVGEVGNEWEMTLYGVHFIETGTILLATTSEKFSGIFALPHFAFTEYMYSVSQDVLRPSINASIEREQARFGAPHNPWSSSSDGSGDGFFPVPHCEYVVYLQQHPADIKYADPNLRYSDAPAINFLENELRNPTGYTFMSVPNIVLSMVAFSPDCGVIIESKGPPDYFLDQGRHLQGPKLEVLISAGRRYSLLFALLMGSQILLMVRQMKEASTPSTRSRISFFTIAVLSLGDGFACMTFLPVGMIDTAYLPLLAAAFLAWSSVTFFGLRFLMDIWSVQAVEQRRQERHQNAQQQHPNAGPQQLESSQNQPPSAQRTTQGGVPVITPAGADTLPAPVTSGQAPPAAPPIIIPSDQDEPVEAPNTQQDNTNTTETPTRRELGALYSRFFFILLGAVFLSLHATSWPPVLRSIYTNVLAFLYLSFWIPQFLRNIQRNCRKALRWDFVIGQSILRVTPFAYFYCVPDNILFVQNDIDAFLVLAVWLWIQVVLLGSQDLLGPRFFVPQGWAPPAYDYHPLLREDEEGANLPIGFTQATEEMSGLSPTTSKAGDGRAATAPRSNGKRVWDCAICMQDIEVPVLPAAGQGGGAEASSGSAAGLGGGILARRTYMVTPCRHIFHTPCLEGWMRYRLQCPICRDVLPPL
ncbi:hypothetical protein BDY21DRAFT_418145 [Lineolata rhizophorae]|uniref:DSC E3 ubiquitin ligase complex subunit A n=1 Tax=Lineolata rhizophorae TaxID=578093 RepID=A0A6A6PDZ3_9PEZI|nr:hypothetical protein BDY21DRAFT_418145 [Lineolata rhizophorae]